MLMILVMMTDYEHTILEKSIIMMTNLISVMMMMMMTTKMVKFTMSSGDKTEHDSFVEC